MPVGRILSKTSAFIITSGIDLYCFSETGFFFVILEYSIIRGYHNHLSEFLGWNIGEGFD